MADKVSMIIIEHARNVSMVDDGNGNRLLGGNGGAQRVETSQEIFGDYE